MHAMVSCLIMNHLEEEKFFAKDYVELMWLMLQQDEPKDYVAATGMQFTVREFVEKAAACVDLTLTWKGSGVDEKGYDQNGRCLVEVDPRYFRPAEVDNLLGDSQLAKDELGWSPKTDFSQLVTEMMEKDLAKV